jgi:hypothetical protein
MPEASIRESDCDLALHVTVLVLHHPGHQGRLRVHEVAQFILWLPHELLHQFRFAQAHVFHRVRGQETVLDVEKRGHRVLGGAPGNEGQIARVLGVLAEEEAPPAVGHGHHVVMPAVDVQRVRGQGPGPDVKDAGQALAGDGVQHLLHQHQPLAGGEVGDAPSGQGKPFAGRRRTVFGFRLNEGQRIPPQVALAVGHRLLEAMPHGSGGGDRIGTGSLADVRLHPGHVFRPFRGSGKAGEGKSLVLQIAH